jgi:hypothetical protein
VLAGAEAVPIIGVVPELLLLPCYHVIRLESVVSRIKLIPMVWILVVDTPLRLKLCVGRIVYAGCSVIQGRIHHETSICCSAVISRFSGQPDGLQGSR